MMNFALTEEQAALKEMVSRFVKQEIVPKAAHYDETSEFPSDIIQKAWQNGIMNVTVPEKFGGMGFGVLDDVVLNEELGAGCLGICTSIVVNTLGSLPVIIGGSDDQVHQFIAPLLEKPELISFCLTEPDSGSDAQSLSTYAQDKGDYYEVTGQKMWITNAGHASLLTVFCTTNKEDRKKGMTCLVIPADAEGVSLGKHEDKMGQRASDTRAITFDKVKVPKSHQIGEIGHGFKIAMKTLDKTRATMAACAVGAARAALEYATQYSKERKQFGRPIADFQAIQFMLADMATKIEAGRMLCYRSAVAIDQGDTKTGSYYSAHAKRFCADMAMEVATDAVQIYGGYGYTKEYPVEKIMRDVKLLQIYEGTSQIQRVVIARHLLKD